MMNPDTPYHLQARPPIRPILITQSALTDRGAVTPLPTLGTDRTMFFTGETRLEMLRAFLTIIIKEPKTEYILSYLVQAGQEKFAKIYFFFRVTLTRL
jgi:hypothetical protein